jgi:CBS domain-containing membrane protein
MRGGQRGQMRKTYHRGHVLHVWAATFLGTFAIAVPTLYLDVSPTAHIFLIGSFGATAGLLFAAPRSDLAQPRNMVLGHLMSALIGVTLGKLVTHHVELAASLAVATAMAAMMLTNCLHPPGGATGMTAILGGKEVHDLGYRYLVTPVLVGVAIMLVVAVVVNNLSADEDHQYPVAWW